MIWQPYARVSERGSSWHEKGIDTSIDLQLEQMAAFIRYRDPDATVLPPITDEFESGRTGIPPGMRRLMAEIEASGNWENLIVCKIDRFSRSSRNGNHIFEMLLDAGKGFVSVQENLDYTSINGQLMLRISLAFAQASAQRTAQDTSDAMRRIASKGEWPAGKVPLGYRRPPRGGERSRNALEVDQVKAETVRDLFRRYAAGESGGDLAKSTGIPKNTILNHILRNPIYLGKIIYAGNAYPGRHEAIIDRTLFDRVQAILPSARKAPRPNARKYHYLLAGLIRCSCGLAMSPASANGRGGKYVYYQCTCGHRVNAERMDQTALDTVGRMEYDRETITAALDRIAELRHEARRNIAPELTEVTREIKRLEKDRAKIEDAFLSGLVTAENKDHWNHRLTDTNRNLALLSVRLDTLNQQAQLSDRDFPTAETIIRQLRWIKTEMDRHTDDPSLQRQLIVSHIKAINYQGDDSYLCTFQPLAGSSNRTEWHPQGDLNELLLIFRMTA